MTGSLRGKVVVITGASSGIGRAAAIECARRGASVVLAARRDAALEQAAAECERLGVQALAVPTDVTDEAQVARLARRAVEAFGRIDVWVNDAGVYMLGKFEDCPPADFRRVVETNLFGVVHGARAVWPHFKERRRGTLINVASVIADAPAPFTSAYGASKAAVRNFSDALRMELSLESGHDIHVCTVMPAGIDTPLFQQAADYAGRAVTALPPVYDVEKPARAIADLAAAPKREVTVGKPAGPFMLALKALAPALYETVMARQVERTGMSDEPAPPTSGNLFEPMPEQATVRGGWTTGGDREPSRPSDRAPFRPSRRTEPVSSFDGGPSVAGTLLLLGATALLPILFAAGKAADRRRHTRRMVPHTTDAAVEIPIVETTAEGSGGG